MVTVASILDDASRIDYSQRVELISALMEDLDPSPHHVSDQEGHQRLEELRSGAAQPLGEEEFWKACGR